MFKKKKMSQAEKHRGWIRMRNLSNVKIAIQVQIILTARNEQRYLGFAVLLNVPPLKLKQHIFLFAKRKEKAPKGKVYFESPASPQSLSTGKKQRDLSLKNLKTFVQDMCNIHKQCCKFFICKREALFDASVLFWQTAMAIETNRMLPKVLQHWTHTAPLELG